MGMFLLAIILVAVGTISLTSDKTNTVGWVVFVVGFLLLLVKLSRYSKRSGSDSHVYFVDSSKDSHSDSSGSDGGGGGE